MMSDADETIAACLIVAVLALGYVIMVIAALAS